ncbi:MAG: hypothetical protein LBL95_09940, partial [Deltaproteobacteria bacterium]|nr:hypothetical protein [Deltaproteobacteria bacterium]
MLLFWGLIGFLQTIFLPGAAICVILVKYRLGFTRFIVLSFIYSLASNYIILYILLYCKIYTRFSMIIIFILFTGILIYYLFNKHKIIKLCINYSFKDDINLNITHIKNINNIFIALISLTTLLVILFYHKYVYTHIDAINSWDVWAVSWASNTYPSTYGDYPQLAAMIMSIPYVYMDTTKIQIFSILTSQFCVIPCLFGLYCLRKSKYMYSAVTAAVGLVWLFAASKGIAPDITVIIFCLLSYIMLQLHLIEYSNGNQDKLYLYSAFIAAAISGTLKQTGLIWVFLLIFIAIYQLAEIGINRKKIYKIIVLPAIISLIFSLSWYIFNTYLIYIGLVPTKIVSIFNNPAYYKGRSFLQRAIYCFFHYSYYSIFILPTIRC